VVVFLLALAVVLLRCHYVSYLRAFYCS